MKLLEGLSLRQRGLLAASSCVFIWSAFIVYSRYGVKSALSPWDLAGLRFMVAGGILLPVFFKRGFGGMPWPRVIALTLTAGLGYAIIAFSGFRYAPAAHASVCMPGMLPFYTALLSVVLLKQSLSKLRLLSLALILAGVGFVASHSVFGDAPPGAWRGDLIFLTASACWATFTVLARKWQADPVTATAFISSLSALVYLPVYFGSGVSTLPQVPLSTLMVQGIFQGLIAVVVASIAFTYAVRVIGPNSTTAVTSLVPGVSALCAAWLLDEPLSLALWFGLALVTVGMIVGVRAIPPAPPAPGAPVKTGG